MGEVNFYGEKSPPPKIANISILDIRSAKKGDSGVLCVTVQGETCLLTFS